MISNPRCQELQQLRGDANTALQRASRIYRFSQFSEPELTEEGHRRIDAMIQHLLVGHDGKPCPAGDRPIIQAVRLDALRMRTKSA